MLAKKSLLRHTLPFYANPIQDIQQQYLLSQIDTTTFFHRVRNKYDHSPDRLTRLLVLH